MRVRTGLARILETTPRDLKGQRVGLVTHAAAVAPDLSRNVDAMMQAGLNITALFSPEHGLYGAVADGEAVADARDARTGLPIYSLYGDTKTPSAGALNQLDALIFDMQDVGVRFYTYVSTLNYVLESAARADLPVIVLDRPNPITGATVEGPCLEPGYASFVGIAQIPLRYGLTIGELARYLNDNLSRDHEGTTRLRASLTVHPMQHWRRDQWFADTGLPWIPTSPAMPRLSTTLLYPGLCLLEGTNLSEGRGTALPFEICGAVWMDGDALAAQLNACQLPGVCFRPIQFVPAPGSRYGGERCGGVQVHVLDRARCRPLSVGLHLIAAIRERYPEDFAWRPSSWEGARPHFDLLMGTDQVRLALDTETAAQAAIVEALMENWKADHTAFAEMCQPYLLYT